MPLLRERGRGREGERGGERERDLNQPGCAEEEEKKVKKGRLSKAEIKRRLVRAATHSLARCGVKTVALKPQKHASTESPGYMRPSDDA